MSVTVATFEPQKRASLERSSKKGVRVIFFGLDNLREHPFSWVICRA